MIWMGKHIPLKETIKLQQWTICAGSVVRNPLTNAGDIDSIPGSGRSPGEGNGKPLQYSCLGNPMDREAWWATVHGVAKGQTRLMASTTMDNVLFRD